MAVRIHYKKFFFLPPREISWQTVCKLKELYRKNPKYEYISKSTSGIDILREHMFILELTLAFSSLLYLLNCIFSVEIFEVLSALALMLSILSSIPFFM